MKILVTGGNGFIGHYVVRQLHEKGVGVVSFHRGPVPQYQEDLAGRVTFVRGDILNPLDLVEAVEKNGVQRIVHMAGLGGPLCQSNPGLAYEINILGTRNVLETARILGIDRVVYASSVALYGDVAGDRLVEESPKNPLSVYGMCKVAAEHLGFTYTENWGLDFVSIRPCMGLGPYRRGGAGKKLTDVVRLALLGQQVRARGGDQTYEMIHVSDSASAFTLAAIKDRVTHKVFHTGTGERRSLSQLAEIVRQEIPGADIEIEPGLDRSGSDRTRTIQPPVDATKAREEGWVPRYTPDDAVRQLIQDYRRVMSDGS